MTNWGYFFEVIEIHFHFQLFTPKKSYLLTFSPWPKRCLLGCPRFILNCIVPLIFAFYVILWFSVTLPVNFWQIGIRDCNTSWYRSITVVCYYWKKCMSILELNLSAYTSQIIFRNNLSFYIYKGQTGFILSSTCLDNNRKKSTKICCFCFCFSYCLIIIYNSHIQIYRLKRERVSVDA